MLNVNDFTECVIRPTLLYIDMWSPEAEKLLLLTAIHESKLTYLRQIKGPARGLFQIEPSTERDNWKNYIDFRKPLAAKIRSLMINGMTDNNANLTINLPYQTAHARIKYMRAPGALPSVNDHLGMATYWKEHYNTPEGKGTIEDFMLNTIAYR